MVIFLYSEFVFSNDILITSVPIIIHCDTLEYVDEYKIIHASGNVNAEFQGVSMKANELEIDANKQFVTARGSVTIIDEGNIINTEGIEYDQQKKEWHISNAKCLIYPWFIESEDMSIYGDTYYLKKSRMTSCLNLEPHYWMDTEKSKVIPRKNFSVTNAVFKVGSIPYFYLPYYYRSLKETSHYLEVFPGYDTTNGFLAKAIYGFPVTRDSYCKLQYDYWGKSGSGEGLEYNYYVSDRYKGTIYGYYTADNLTQRNRWKARMGHWQRLSSKWFVQADLGIASDESFNRDYYRESWNVISNELKSSLGFTRQTQKDTLRISASRGDQFDRVAGKYFIENYNAPRIEYTLMPVKQKWFSSYIGFNTVFSQNYDYQRDYSMWESTSDLYITRQFKPEEKTVFNPKIGIIESWQDKTDKNNYDDIHLTKLYSDMNLRRRINWYSNIDLNYKIQFRTEKNKSSQDISADDYGIEVSKLKLMYYSIPMNELIVRVYSGYDFRNPRSQQSSDWKTKFDPVASDLIMSFRNMSLYFKHEQKIEPFSVASTNLDFNVGSFRNKYFGLGVGYNGERTGEMGIRGSLGFWPTKKWHVQVSNIGYAKNDLIHTQSQKFEVYRDLHCWEARLTYDKLDESERYLFNIGLKISSEGKGKLYKTSYEREWYPWR